MLGYQANTADLKSATGLNSCGGSSPPSGTRRKNGHRPQRRRPFSFQGGVRRGAAGKKEGGRRPRGLRPPEIKPGGVLLSHRRILQYPRRWGPSLPCSEWERVFPPLSGRRKKASPGGPGKKANAQSGADGAATRPRFSGAFAAPSRRLRGGRFETAKPHG